MSYCVVTVLIRLTFERIFHFTKLWTTAIYCTWAFLRFNMLMTILTNSMSAFGGRRRHRRSLHQLQETAGTGWRRV